MFLINKLDLLTTSDNARIWEKENEGEACPFPSFFHNQSSYLSDFCLCRPSALYSVCCVTVLFLCSLDIFNDPKDRSSRTCPYIAEQSSSWQVL